MARGEGELLFAHTKADGGLHYYLSFRQPADWFTQHGLTTKLVVVTQFLSQELAQWVPMYHEGFRVTAAFEFLTIYRRVLLVAGYAVS